MQHVAAFTLLLLPGAYVALDTGTLTVLGPWRTLRVRLACDRPPAISRLCAHAVGLACVPGATVLTGSQCWPAGDLCRGVAQRGALRPLLGGGAAAAHDADAPVQCRAWLRRQVSACSGNCGAACPWAAAVGTSGGSRDPPSAATAAQAALLRESSTSCTEAACRWSPLMAAAHVQACPPRRPPGRPPSAGGPHPVSQRVPHPLQQRLGLLPGKDAPADHHVGHHC